MEMNPKIFYPDFISPQRAIGRRTFDFPPPQKDTEFDLKEVPGQTREAVLALLAVCFGFALLLDLTTSVTLLDAYLATTPGGLFAVLAVAFGAGANTTFILAVQGLRLLVMVMLAPFVVRRLTARPSAHVAAG